jgi:tRNA G18 (ribose-2'-O)-methylase SpoU
MRSLVLIAHNVRSTHNVGSLLRTAEGLGVIKVYLTGYTPYPLAEDDARLPHIAQRVHQQIHKTALDAENSVPWEHADDIHKIIETLKTEGFIITAVEQTKTAISLPDFEPPQKIALIVGREIEGVEPEVLEKVDSALEIPMFGKKESFNVVQAAAMALYHCRFR